MSDKEGFFRREEDDRWLKMQKEVMNIVTTQRTNQQELARLEIDLGKLVDHVDDVDDHLRGVSGKESLDTRVTLLEREFEMHGVLLRRISEQFGSLYSLVEGLKDDVSTLKITKAVTEKTDGGKSERLKIWLTFWSPIILSSIALMASAAKITFDNWGEVRGLFHRDPRPQIERLQDEIEQRRANYKAEARHGSKPDTQN